MSRPLVPETASDAELLAAVSGGGGDARRAQQAFYQRHVRYLFGVLQKQRTRLLRLAGLSVEDLVQDTFQRAFDRAATFKAEPGLDEDRARRRTRAWLGRIAQNLTVDTFRRFREVSASPYLEQVEAPSADDAPPSSRPELRPIRAAFEALTDREQDVLRVTALYHKAEGKDRLPNDVSAELASRWGITNENVRAIRSRAMKKLQRAVQAPELREQRT
jgi:RNA polymerase sigma factor (sigma-70 family)